MLTPHELTGLIVKALDSKKAQDIKVLKTFELTVLADYFIICTATSTTQVKTLTGEVEKVAKENDEPMPRSEGYRAGGWVLVDFGSVVVHLFLKELRDFYSLERLWSDAKEIDIKEWLD